MATMREFTPPRTPATLLCLALACAVAPPAAAQETLQSGEYTITRWTTAQGLPSNVARGLAQTPDGFLWVATMGGLARFDGVSFVIFDSVNTPQLGSGRITAVSVDRSGRLWIGDLGGNVVVHEDGAFRVVTTDLAASAMVPDLDRGVWVLRYADQSLWHCTPEGCNELIDRGVRAIAADANGEIWISDNRGGHLLEPDRRSVGRTTGPAGPGSRALEAGIVVPPDQGAAAPQRVLRLIRELGLPPEQPRGLLRQGVRDARDVTWWSNGRLPLLWSRDDRAANLLAGTGSANSVMLDRDGSLWVASETEGLMLVARTIARKVLPFPVRRVVFEPDGSFWTLVGLGPQNALHPPGLGLPAGAQATVVRIKDGSVVEVPGSSVRPHAGWPTPASSGGYWVLHRVPGRSFPELDRIVDGAVVESHDLFESVSEEWPVSQASDPRWGNAVEDSRGRLWTAAGPGRQDAWAHRDGELLFSVRGERLGETRAGEQWFLTDGGLSVLEGEALSLRVRLPEGVHEVRGWLEDSHGHIWLATYGSGLWSVASGRLRQLTTTEGLPSNYVGELLEDDEDRLWVNSNAGVFVVRLEDLEQGFEGRLREVPYRLASTEEMAAGVAQRCPEGTFLFAAIDGTIEIDPDALGSTSAPSSFVLGIETEEDSYHASERFELGLGERRLRISYTAPSPARGSGLVFRYRLSGVDPDWVSAGKRREATYGLLSPGSYRFEVMARPTLESWGAPDRVTIVVPPWFWETTWFRLLVAAGLLTAAAVAVQLQLRAARARQEEEAARDREMRRRFLQGQEDERGRIARDLHDDLGQRLASASINVSLSRRSVGVDREETEQRLADLEDQLQEISADVRRVSHELHPSQFAHLGPRAAFEDLFEEFERSSSTPVELSIPGSLPESLDTDLAICLYRVAQQALTNIAQHAEATRVTAELTVSDDVVRLVISDDGCGFDVDSVESGLGLASMHERVRLENGTIRFHGRSGGGTAVEVEVPLRPGDDG
jgi:signal transduction histidine kinase/ligand-binding sensor domain-containing protein